MSLFALKVVVNILRTHKFHLSLYIKLKSHRILITCSLRKIINYDQNDTPLIYQIITIVTCNNQRTENFILLRFKLFI